MALLFRQYENEIIDFKTFAKGRKIIWASRNN